MTHISLRFICAVICVVSDNMKLQKVIVLRVVVLIFVFMAFPTYESMFNSFRPPFTNPGKNSRDSYVGDYIEKKRLGLYFGINMQESDVKFKERWHRVRLGAPLQAITLD